MKPAIRRPDPRSEFDTPERCAIIEVSNDDEDPAASIARARVRPGVTTAWHELEGTTERYLVVSGSGLVEVGDRQPERVWPGDVVLIPAGVRQRITNDGQADLLFYAICTPRFRQACYRSLE